MNEAVAISTIIVISTILKIKIILQIVQVVEQNGIVNCIAYRRNFYLLKKLKNNKILK